MNSPTASLSDRIDPWTVVKREEFLERQRKARELAAGAGLDGIVVWSKGGAFMDMSQDVLYLANHYSQQPYMGDEAGIGTARSHGVCLLPVEGPTTVVVDVPWWRPDLVVADEVVPTIEVTEAAAEAIRGAGLAAGRIGVVGSSYMSAAAYLGLAAALPDAELVRVDDLVERIRIHKSPAELELIRAASARGNATMDSMMEAVVEGATEAEAVGEGSRTLIAAGGVLYDAACSSGPWSGQFVHNRLPSADATRRLQPGDIFHVDCYGSYGGYMFDFARARCVGDEPSDGQRELLDGVIECVEAICAAIRPGAPASDASKACGEWLKDSVMAPWSLEEEQEMDTFPAAGHGIGMMWEHPYLVADDETPLEPGMYMAAEILLAHPCGDAAIFEHNGIVTEDGYEILTTARERWH